MAKPYRYDKNGYPLDLDHPWTRPAEEQEREHQRAFAHRLDQFERNWRAGDLVAPAEAARLCRLYQQPIPRWLENAFATLVVQHMPNDEKRDRRAFNNHRRRWETVRELGERQQQLLEQFNDDRGKTWEMRWKAVSEILDGTEAAGSPETVRASYKLIEAAGGEHASLESYWTLVGRKRRRKQTQGRS
jgi:hypothetical protein